MAPPPPSRDVRALAVSVRKRWPGGSMHLQRRLVLSLSRPALEQLAARLEVSVPKRTKQQLAEAILHNGPTPARKQKSKRAYDRALHGR